MGEGVASQSAPECRVPFGSQLVEMLSSHMEWVMHHGSDVGM